MSSGHGLGLGAAAAPVRRVITATTTRPLKSEEAHPDLQKKTTDEQKRKLRISAQGRRSKGSQRGTSR